MSADDLTAEEAAALGRLPLYEDDQYPDNPLGFGSEGYKVNIPAALRDLAAAAAATARLAAAAARSAEDARTAADAIEIGLPTIVLAGLAMDGVAEGETLIIPERRRLDIFEGDTFDMNGTATVDGRIVARGGVLRLGPSAVLAIGSTGTIEVR